MGEKLWNWPDHTRTLQCRSLGIGQWLTVLTVLDDQVISQHLCRAISRKTNILFCLQWIYKHMWNSFTWKNTHKSKLHIRYICTCTYNYIYRWIDDRWLKEIAHVYVIQNLSTFGLLGLFSANKKGEGTVLLSYQYDIYPWLTNDTRCHLICWTF